MSPTTSAAMTSYEYDEQSEKEFSRRRKMSPTSWYPLPEIDAPSTVTGSFLDQMANRGWASPLWNATSASFSRDPTQPKKSSCSLMLHPQGPRPTSRRSRMGPGVHTGARPASLD